MPFQLPPLSLPPPLPLSPLTHVILLHYKFVQCLLRPLNQITQRQVITNDQARFDHAHQDRLKPILEADREYEVLHLRHSAGDHTFTDSTHYRHQTDALQL